MNIGEMMYQHQCFEKEQLIDALVSAHKRGRDINNYFVQLSILGDLGLEYDDFSEKEWEAISNKVIERIMR